MPPILRLEPYEACMRSPGALYCAAYMSFVSDKHSALLTQMQVNLLLRGTLLTFVGDNPKLVVQMMQLFLVVGRLWPRFVTNIQTKP